MKKIFTLLLAMVSASSYLSAQNSSPAADAYGYTWKNSNVSGGPTYRWVEIVSNNKGTRVAGLDDDNASGFINMGFSMKYYWTDVNKVKIGSNGWVSFSDINNIAHGFPDMPQADANSNFVAPFMADLNFSTVKGPNTGKVYYWVNQAADSMVITYNNVPFWSNPVAPSVLDYTGSNTFQVIFTKADNGITYQYKKMEAFIPTMTPLNDVVIGIENITQTIGMEIMKDAIPLSNTAYKFYRPANSTFQVTDLKANWAFNNRNGAVIGLKNQSMLISGNIANVGNTNAGTYSVGTKIKQKPSGPTPYSQTISLPKLRVGRDTTYTYNAAFTPTLEGSFALESNITMTSDANPANNLNVTEMQIVDTTGKKREVSLQYFDAQPEGITSFGAAVYFKPPFYPTEVRSVDAVIVADPGATSAWSRYNVRVYAESPTGGLGTVLFDSTLLKNDVILNALNTIEIPVKKFKTITSGGFYVAWVPLDSINTYIAVDKTAPFSYRNYEVQAGQINDYRSSDTEDFAISASIGTKLFGALGIKKEALISNSFALYPNPAQDNVKISYELKDVTESQLTITNLIGSTVKTINFGKQQKIEHSLNTSDLRPGIYLCTLKAGQSTVTKRLVITK